MKSQRRILTLNKREDWLEGAFCGMVAEGDRVVLPAGWLSGCYCTRVIDSGQRGFRWERVMVQAKVPEEGILRSYAWVSERPVLEQGSTPPDWLRAQPNLNVAVQSVFTPAASSGDFLIGRTGRYLCLLFEIIVPGGTGAALEGVRLHISGDHMTDYLPAIYQGEDFTRRFLSIFDSLLMDMEEQIYALPGRFDYESAGGSELEWLAEWMCIADEGGGEAQLRTRIGSALQDYEEMYTLSGVKRSIRQLTGREPLVIESADVDPNRADCPNPALYRKLYGTSPYRFFVLLDEDTFQDYSQTELFLERMQQRIPAEVELDLILLKKTVRLDWHTYLGVNSVVGGYVPASIGEGTALQYDTIIGG